MSRHYLAMQERKFRPRSEKCKIDVIVRQRQPAYSDHIASCRRKSVESDYIFDHLDSNRDPLRDVFDHLIDAARPQKPALLHNSDRRAEIGKLAQNMRAY